MRLEDAPPPGWYPDPEGRAHLRWWEGTDWTDERRALPITAETENALRVAVEAAASAGAAAGPHAGQRRTDTSQIVSQVRDATREELGRAGDLLSQRMQTSMEHGRSLVAEYADRVLRWVRIAVVLAALLVIAWFVFQFVAQVTLLEWLGDRIDNVTDR